MLSRVAIAFTMLAASATSSPFAPKSENSAKGKMMSKIMSKARRLNDAEEYIPDISGYSLKFVQCQFVKAYDDELAQDEEYGSVLATERFVVFRLIPTGTSGDYGYGEYLADMDQYLEAVVQYQEEVQQEMCNECEENCNMDDGNNRRFLFRRLDVDCDECVDTCQKIENMEENGYIDATEFLECQQIYENDDDNEEIRYFAGPYCSGGEKIRIGVFLDEYCYTLDSTLDVEDYLADNDGVEYKLSHALLSKAYSDEEISCLVVDEEQDDDDDKEPEVMEVCEQLWEESAKCELHHGFDDGYSNYYGYENQYNNEDAVCDFIASLEGGTYDENGEIVVKSGTSYAPGSSAASGGQKFFLTFFIIGTIGLAVYAAMLHSQLTKGSKTDLSTQGGAMA